jgi:hypothetical protein
MTSKILSQEPYIDPSAELRDCNLGRYTEVGARTRLLEVTFAARIQRLAWWDWPHARLREALPDFRRLSAAAFLERYEPQLQPASQAQAATVT